MVTENKRMQQRRRTAAQLISENPVLAAGELATATDVAILKRGDGSTAWNDLPEIGQNLVTAGDTISGFGTLLSVAAGQTVTVTASGFLQALAFGPIIVYDDPFSLSGGRSVDDGSVLKNPAGVAKTMPHHTGFYSNATVRGDGATFTTTRSAFLDSGKYEVVNSGTVAASEHVSFDSASDIGSGVTMTLRKGLKIADTTGSGTLTTQIGIDIGTLAKGGTNIGIRNASTTVYTPSVATLSAASSSITANATIKRLDNTSGGTLTLTSTPTVADGQDGQFLYLVNASANDVIVQDETSLAGSNLRLNNAANVRIKQREMLTLIFSSTTGDWIDLRRASV